MLDLQEHVTNIVSLKTGSIWTENYIHQMDMARWQQITPQNFLEKLSNNQILAVKTKNIKAKAAGILGHLKLSGMEWDEKNDLKKIWTAN